MHVSGIGTKKTMVYEASKLLEHRYQNDIKASDIAALCHCSSATIYKRFGSLDYLLYVASVGFIEDYMREFKGIQESTQPPFERYLSGWYRFNKYAFRAPDVYVRLFWGKYNYKFADAVGEYLELFPDIIDDSDKNLFYRVFFTNGDLIQRDMVLLSIAARQKVISLKEAEFLSITNAVYAESFLRKVIGASDEEKSRAEKECNDLIRKNSKIGYDTYALLKRRSRI